MSNFINRFFWFFAGSDSAILKRCSVAEKTKHFGIGATVLITAMIAIISGMYAIQTLIESQIWSVFFGVFWGFVILNIDRLLVSTMRKDVNDNKWKEAIHAIPRLLLAIVIAIVISKPVEVKILENQIEKQLLYDQVKEGKQLKALNKSASSIKDSKGERNVADTRIMELTDEEKEITNEQGYLTLEKEEKNCDEKVNRINRSIDKKNIEYSNLRNRSSYWKQIEVKIDSVGREHLKPFPPDLIGEVKMVSVKSKWAIKEERRISREIKNLKKEKPNCGVYFKKKEDYKAERKAIINSEITNQKKKRTWADRRIEGELIKLDSTAAKDSIILEKSGNDIFGKLVALENAKYRKESLPDTLSNGEVIFVSKQETTLMRNISWAIMAFFFILEICPIFVKILSNRGPYDDILQTQEFKVKEEERQAQADIKSRTSTQISILDGKNDHLVNSELDTSQEVMEQIKQAQLDLGKEVVAKWKEQKLSELETNPESFINNVVK